MINVHFADFMDGANSKTILKLAESMRTAVTVGTFDGVHRGHLAVFEELLEVARCQALKTLVVTFDPHPRQVMQPGNEFKFLTSRGKKLQLIAELGIDYVVVMKFNRALSKVTPEKFITDYLIRRYGLHALVMGYDHALGKNRAGDERVLKKLSNAHGFALHKVAPVIVDGRPVSSSRLRDVIEEGDMQLAASLLDRFYSFTGLVVHGANRGKKLGHPTANLTPLSEQKLLFPEGVYAALADLDGFQMRCVLHYGPRPTFDDPEVTFEINLFDFSGDLYGRKIEVSIVERIRPILRFETARELEKQMDKDDLKVKKVFERVEINFKHPAKAIGG